MSDLGIIDYLRKQHAGMLKKGEFALINKNDIGDLLAQIDNLMKERDEARREAATFYARQFYKDDAVDRMSRIYAEESGWDCFKEDGK